MKKFKNIKISKDTVIKVVTVLIAVICIASIIAIKARSKEAAAIIYDYTVEEKALAEKVKEYLTEHITLNAEKTGKIADAAVQSYCTILTSGVTNVSDEHTEALEQRMEHVLRAEISAEQVTDEDFQVLSNGICSIIWDAVLEQFEILPVAEGMDEEYKSLVDSIQKQIDALEKRNMSITISANIKGNGVTEEELETRDNSILSKIGNKVTGIKSEIMKEIETKLGDVEDGKDGANGQNGANGKDGVNGKAGADGKKGSDGKDGDDGRDGRDGKDGIKGENGTDGIKGMDGKNGTDGLSTYYMFSAYSNGREGETEYGTISMSSEQSNLTKYMGISHAASSSAPESPDEYTWSEYKDYIIFSEIDEAGVPTVYIQ